MAWETPKTWSAAVLTSADMNTYVSDNLDFLKANIALEAPVELTLDTDGAVTKTKSYHAIDTFETAASDTLVNLNGGSDGDIVYIQAANDDRTIIVSNLGGNIHCGGDIYLVDTHTIIGLMYDVTLAEWHTLGAYTTLRTFLLNTFVCPNPGTDWTPEIVGCTLGASKSNKKFGIPLPFFKLGDGLISYKVVGDATQTNALTLNAKLVRVNLGDGLTTTDVDGGDIAEISGDGNFDVEATLTATETIATDKQYIIEFSGLTGVSDTITVMGVEVSCLRVL